MDSLKYKSKDKNVLKKLKFDLFPFNSFRRRFPICLERVKSRRMTAIINGGGAAASKENRSGDAATSERKGGTDNEAEKVTDKRVSVNSK